MKNLFYLSCTLLVLGGCTKTDLDIGEKYVPVQGITIDKKELTMINGDVRGLYATVVPGNATDPEVIWTSENPSIVSVDQTGKLTAVSPSPNEGETTRITASTSDGKFMAECDVEVMAYGIIVKNQNGDTIDEFLLPSAAGGPKTYYFTTQVVAPNTLGQGVEWHSANPSLITVTDDGAVTVFGSEEGSTKITITSTLAEEVTLTLEAKIQEVTVTGIRISEVDILLPVNILDTTKSEGAVTQQGIINYHSWDSNRLKLMEDSNGNPEPQNKYLFIQGERPEIVKDIIISFEPASPSYTSIQYEFLNPKGHPWDLTFRPKIDSNGEEVINAQGNAVWELILPRGGLILPNGGWDAWDKYDNKAFVTLVVRSTDPNSTAEARCNIEVYDYGKYTTGLGRGTNAGSPYDLILNKKPGYKEWLLTFEREVDGNWEEVAVYADDASTTKYPVMTVRRGTIDHFRVRMPRYTMPYISVNRGPSNTRFINTYIWDPDKDLSAQNALQNTAATMSQYFGDDQYVYWAGTNNPATAIIRTVTLNGTGAGQPGYYYQSKDIFPYYQSAKDATCDWYRFNIRIDN